MSGTDGESLQAAHLGAPPNERRPRAAVMATAVAILAAIGIAGCQGHASSAASGGAAASPSASGAERSSSAAPVSLTWSSARAPLPADTGGVSGEYAMLEGVSCPEVGHCVAVGSDKADTAAGVGAQGLIETLVNGTWTPTAVPGVFSKADVASLTAISCPALGSCVAVGFVYRNPSVDSPVIQTLSGGHWRAVKAPLPADALLTGSATLNDIACPATGTCVTTGWYINRGGKRDAYIDTLSHGSWTAKSAPLPLDAVPEASSSRAATYLATVTCTAPGVCVATGQFSDFDREVQPFIDTLSGGTWTAKSATLPADASTLDGQDAGLWAVGCSAPGTCVAGGHYLTGSGQPRLLTETLSDGTWSPSAIPLPAGAAANQKWSQYQDTTVGGLACAPGGSCVATAGYLSKSGAILPLIATQLPGGKWTLTNAPLPPDADPSTPQTPAYLVLDACPADGQCLIVGSYPANDGTLEGIIETAVPGHG